MSSFKYSKGSKPAFYLLAGLLSLSGLVMPYAESGQPRPDQGEVLGQTFSQLPLVNNTRPVLKTEAEAFTISSRSGYAIDLKTGQPLYEKDANLRWPTASLAKLMTAVVVANTISLSKEISVDGESIKVAQPVMGLEATENITVYNLLKGMLITSANDAAAALAAEVSVSEQNFVELMNSMAQNLDLENTHFSNPVGFDDPNQYSTALDLTRLTVAFLRHPLLAEIVQTKSTKVTSSDGKITHWLVTSNKLLDDDRVLGVKTGYTDSARGNLILLAQDQNNHQVLTVILGSENREADSLALVDWIFASYEFVN